eukprot:gene1737-1897_t
MTLLSTSRLVRSVSKPWMTRSLGRGLHFDSSNLQLKVVEHHGGIAVLTLCRQQGKNAFSREMIKDFNTILDQLHQSKSTAALVVHSEVKNVFCAGADLKERLEMPDDQVGDFVKGLRTLFHNVSKLPFPTIAAIEGVALGGGLELALACDVRIAGEAAGLGLPETALAIIPGAGGTQRLPRVIGVAKAKELIFTGRKLSAKEAEDIGLVNSVVPAGQAFASALAMAKVISEKGPIGVRMAKQAIDAGVSVSLDEAMEVEDKCYREVVYTEDRKEGLRAFVEKRSPQYQGK